MTDGICVRRTERSPLPQIFQDLLDAEDPVLSPLRTASHFERFAGRNPILVRCLPALVSAVLKKIPHLRG